MLQLKLNNTNQIDAAGKQVFLSDSTGNYSIANPTGYGTPNLSRSQLAVFPIGNSVDSVGLKSPLKFVANNPLTSTEWIALVTQDGWLQFTIVAIEAVQTPVVTNYVLDDVIFSIDDFRIYKVVAGQTAPVFEQVQVDEVTAPLSSSLPFDQFFLANSIFIKNQLNKKFTESLINSENLSNSVITKRIKEQYDTVRGIVQAALYQFCIGNKFQAAKFIEFLITNNYGQL